MVGFLRGESMEPQHRDGSLMLVRFILLAGLIVLSLVPRVAGAGDPRRCFGREVTIEGTS